MSLAALQDRLQDIYEVHPGHSVDDFVITDRRIASQLDPNARCPSEKLLMFEQGVDLEISLYLDPSVVHALGSIDDRPSGRRLSDYCLAVEGVSHFVFVAWRAQHGRRISAVEMELQAEIDKFVTVVERWAKCAEQQHALRYWLFEDIKFDQGLTDNELDRYQDANNYASKYCRWLQYEFLHQQRHQEMLRELRRFYRLGRADKFRHIEVSITQY